MSIAIVNAARLITANNTNLAGQNQAAVAFSFRIDDPSPLSVSWYGYSPFQSGGQNALAILAYSIDETGKTIRLRFFWRSSAASSNVCDAYTTVSPGIVYAIMLGYDSANPSNQVLYVNGVPTLMNNPQTNPIATTSQALNIGTTGVGNLRPQFSIDNLMMWSGYVPSQSEVLSIMNGTDDPTTIGLSATWRGWYRFNGTPGAVPTLGDTAIGNAIDGTSPFTPSVAGSPAGSSLLYGAAMPFVPQSGFRTPLVCSSGESIEVLAKVNTSDAAINITAGSATVMPTIRINGGSQITLERPLYSSQHEGLVYFLPSGYKVEPGDSVTLSAPAGWFSTALGVADPAVDVACTNKSGVPIYGDDPVTSRIGFNYTYPPSTYWGFYQATRNWALRIPYDNSTASAPALRPDGTFSSFYQGRLTETNGTNPIDKTTYPQQHGKWVASWDNNDPANPTTVLLYSDAVGTANELTAYRNDGDVNGVGCARVWDFQYVTRPYTLAADVDASTTSIPLTSVANLDINGKIWLKFDDEYMSVTSFNTGTKVATVVRGSDGSTAASHTSGTVGSSAWYRRNISVYIQISGANGTPNYSNLVINSPSDWTPPDPPAPVVLDRSYEYQRGPSQFVRDSMVGGLGVTRHMDACGTYVMFSEVEHTRNDSDPYWNYYFDYIQRFRVKSWEPMDPATTPYVYSHTDEGGACETYSATLGANINTAPDAGTVETITISDAATAPVMSGSRVLIGSEWMYVRDVVGTQCEVVRGSRNTTPTTHTAGPITVGWRIPITSVTQYQDNGHVAVVATTDVQHKLRTGIPQAGPKSNDMNPLARSTVTLLEDFNSGGKSFKISADPSFWQYIVTDLVITFEPGTSNAESVSVISGDQATGIVTCRYGTSKTHLAGATGATSSSGVYCLTAGGKYGWTLGTASAVVFVVGPNKYMVALEIWVGDNTNPTMVGSTQTWDESPQIVNGLDNSQVVAQYPAAVCSWEYSTRATRLCPGADHWLNINMTASDDLVDYVARKIRDGLPAGQHRVIVELGNEIWNALIPFYTPTMRYSKMLGLYNGTGSSWMDRWVLRTKAVTERVRAIFAEQGRGGEVLLALPWQTAGIGDALARARANSVDVDVCSAGYYVLPGNTQAHIDAFNLSTNAQCGDIYRFDIEHRTVGGSGAKLRNDAASLALHRSLTNNRKIEFICYEGGIESSIGIPANGTSDVTKYPHGMEKQLDVLYDPNWYNVDRDFYRVMKKIGDVDGMAVFTHCQSPAYLNFGSGKAAYMWGVTGWHGQPAGRGDGSDGKADNRLCLAEPGHPNSKSPFVSVDEQNVSVRLQSIIDHNIAFFNPEPPPENVDVPQRFPTRITRRRRRNTTPILSRTSVVTAVIPPTPPSPVPVVGRRSVVFRLTVS